MAPARGLPPPRDRGSQSARRRRVSARAPVSPRPRCDAETPRAKTCAVFHAPAPPRPACFFDEKREEALREILRVLRRMPEPPRKRIKRLPVIAAQTRQRRPCVRMRRLRGPRHHAPTRGAKSRRGFCGSFHAASLRAAAVRRRVEKEPRFLNRGCDWALRASGDSEIAAPCNAPPCFVVGTGETE